VPLLGDKSLLQLTAERVSTITNRLILVGSEDHRFLIQDALAETQEGSNRRNKQGDHHGEDESCDILLEPFPRNTAAAMALAALWQLKKNPSSNTSLLLFCPSDHHIPDQAAFKTMVLSGTQAALSGAIVTFGVRPSYPSSAYGYIQHEPMSGSNQWDGVAKVVRFVEKPQPEVAAQYVLDGHFLWNAGIFLMRGDVLLKALAVHAPDILSACEKAMEGSALEVLNQQGNSNPFSSAFIRPKAEHLKACRSESIDYAVMEHHKDIVVCPFTSQWSDVGSWNAVAELSPSDPEGNQISGKGLALESKNTYINAPHRTVVCLGVEDLLVVDTADAVLVANKSKAESVKQVVALLEQQNDPKALLHRKVSRPWGWYDSIDQGERFQVKRIGVKAGASLSLQKHHHRAEHWIVVKGTAEVTCGEKTFLMTENQSTYIPIGEVHRLHNPGKTDLEMIEVQSGSYLGEDDIVRLEDTYGRV
jgi:mannose-1-phosphate guanylyltransferase/mannose-6-phosphate isomerase